MSFNVYGYDVYISLIVHLHGVNLGQIFNVIVKIENMFKILVFIDEIRHKTSMGC